MGCLATTALGSLICLGVPFKFSNATKSQRSSDRPRSDEASSFQDAFARHRKDASSPGMMFHVTSLDHSRLKSRSRLLGESWPQVSSFPEMERWFQAFPVLLCSTVLPHSPMRYLVRQSPPCHGTHVKYDDVRAPISRDHVQANACPLSRIPASSIYPLPLHNNITPAAFQSSYFYFSCVPIASV